MQQENPIQIRVEDTNAEAMLSKLSAINRGYFQDEFADQFVKLQGKKDVIIHRGYWLRYHLFTRIITAFMSQPGRRQIISLGCGYDTLPYHLQKSDKDFLYLEMDLPIVVKQKVKKIENSKKIKSTIKDLQINWDTYELTSSRYGLFGCDLVNLELFKTKLDNFKIDYNLPTLIFAECVLTYIEADATNALLTAISQWFKQATFLNYEMFNPNDQFGKMMVRNFEVYMYRGCPLVGITAFPTMQAHKERLEQRGFLHVQIQNMQTLYKKGTNQEELKRIEQIELLDEWEEWNIMQAHYFVAIATNFEPSEEQQIHLI